MICHKDVQERVSGIVQDIKGCDEVTKYFWEFCFKIALWECTCT